MFVFEKVLKHKRREGRFAAALRWVTDRNIERFEDGLLHTWALLMPSWLFVRNASMPLHCFYIVRTHCESCSGPVALRKHILECQVSRAWAGDCCNVRYAVSPELHEVGHSVGRLLVAGGARLRYVAAPRGPFERAVAAPLTARVGHLATQRVAIT